MAVGHATCGAVPPDYVPPDPTNVVVWIDACHGTGDVPHGTTSASETMDLDDNGETFSIAARAVLPSQALLSAAASTAAPLAAAASTAVDTPIHPGQKYGTIFQLQKITDCLIFLFVALDTLRVRKDKER